MRVSTATVPAQPNRENEDFVAASNNVVVLLDGAGNPPGSPEGCRHGVAWFSRTLGTTLLNIATDQPARSLTQALREAIHAVADQHRDTCDLLHPGSPSATVVAVRQLGSELQYLVLADSVLVLHDDKHTLAITDDREANVGRQFRTRMDSFPSGSPEHAEQLRQYVETLRSFRNRPDGFWVASSDPSVASQAIVGAASVAAAKSAVLLSDGASRLVDRFHLSTWSELVKLITTTGPDAVLDRVRQAERSDPNGQRWPRGKVSDDATAAHVIPSPG